MKNDWIIGLLFVLTSCGATWETNKNRNTMEFIPKKFENIDFGSVETAMCPCSPNYPHKLENANTLKINVPEKILFHRDDEMIIPVCIAYTTSFLRELKYLNFFQKMISTI